MMSAALVLPPVGAETRSARTLDDMALKIDAPPPKKAFAVQVYGEDADRFGGAGVEIWEAGRPGVRPVRA